MTGTKLVLKLARLHTGEQIGCHIEAGVARWEGRTPCMTCAASGWAIMSCKTSRVSRLGTESKWELQDGMEGDLHSEWMGGNEVFHNGRWQ